MRDKLQFYIDGQWTDPVTPQTIDVINPATEVRAGRVSLGGREDVDKAVAAARRAFQSWSRTSRADRLAILDRVIEEYGKRMGEIADAIRDEMGAPNWLAQTLQAPVGAGHFAVARQALAEFSFEEQRGSTLIAREPIGVVAFITPWNWPMNQLAAKVAPALAVGCTMVVKPSEIAPFSALILAEVMDAAGVPAGVFNLINGYGRSVGAALASHPEVDMISITGSTRAGIEVARNAASTVKRVHQELGGKSANIVLDDAHLPSAIGASVFAVMMNSGQSCMAPTRMLVPHALLDEAAEHACRSAEALSIGDPASDAQIGPVVSEAQWSRIQGFIANGIEEGATLVTGGTGKPEGLATGYYVKPTIFRDVTNDMTIAREEIFGPVLVLIGYDDEEEAIRIANDSDYGLAGYVQSTNLERANRVASRLRAGYININNADLDLNAPFGGYKRSGNGREFGDHAFAEFLELKSILGSRPAGA